MFAIHPVLYYTSAPEVILKMWFFLVLLEMVFDMCNTKCRLRIGPKRHVQELPEKVAHNYQFWRIVSRFRSEKFESESIRRPSRRRNLHSAIERSDDLSIIIRIAAFCEFFWCQKLVSNWDTHHKNWKLNLREFTDETVRQTMISNLLFIFFLRRVQCNMSVKWSCCCYRMTW